MSVAMLQRTVQFLRSIGFTVEEQEGANGFLEAVLINNGKLLYEPFRAQPSDLLHEAGHLAVIPARYRADAGDDLSALFERMCQDISIRFKTDPDLDPDSQDVRGALQAGETEATAWAFAAGRAIGLPDHLIIQDHEYDGEGAEVRDGLAVNKYLGINGLVAGGMCQNVKSFPTLTRWLQL